MDSSLRNENQFENKDTLNGNRRNVGKKVQSKILLMKITPQNVKNLNGKTSKITSVLEISGDFNTWTDSINYLRTNSS